MKIYSFYMLCTKFRFINVEICTYEPIVWLWLDKTLQRYLSKMQHFQPKRFQSLNALLYILLRLDGKKLLFF
jgi:hypothetical protein